MGVMNRNNALAVAIGADNSDLQSGLKDSEKMIEQFAKAVEKVSKTTDLAFDGNSLKEFKENIDAQRKTVELLENQYKKAKQTLDTLGDGDGGKIFSNEEMKKAAVEYNEAKKLLSEVKRELDLENKALEKKESGYKAVSAELDKLKPKQTTYMTQIRHLKQELQELEMAGKKETDQYKAKAAELEEIGTAYNRVNKEAKLLTTAGSTALAGIIQGISGVAGAFSATQGVTSLFVKDNEKLAAIQTKLQAAMAITIGLQQVSSTLHATSSFRIGLVSKATNLLSIANTKLATTFGISTAAANVLLGTLTVGLSVAITALIAVYNKYSSDAEKATLATNKFNTAVASSASSARIQFERLRLEWEKAGKSLAAKEELIRKNISAYNEFGIKINTVNDADKMFIDNADVFREAIMTRAKSVAAMEIASENYKEYLENMAKAEQRAINRSLTDKILDGSNAIKSRVESIFQSISAGKYVENFSEDYFANQAVNRDKAAAEKKREESEEWLLKALGFDDLTKSKLKESGGQLTDDVIKGSKDYWQKIRDEQQRVMESHLPTSDVFKLAKKTRDDADKMLEQWNKTNTKQLESAADKARKQAQDIVDQEGKIKTILSKQALERQRALKDLENQSTQARIDAMLDGAEKVEMQREHANRLELQAIDRQKEDYILAFIQAEKEKFDAQEELLAKQNSKYTKKVFDTKSVIVDTSIFDSIKKEIENKQANYPQILAKQEAKDWNEYFIQFGAYQEKRKAIINKYNQEMDDAETQGKKDILYETMQSELDELDNSVKNSTTLMGQLFADASRKSVNEIQAIIDKAELLMQYLEATKDEQGNALIGGKTISKGDILGLGISEKTLKDLELSTHEVESLRNAINRLKEDLGAKSPFKLFQNQIDSALKKLKQGGQKNLAQGISEIGAAVNKFSPEVAQFGKDLSDIVGNDDLGNKIDGITESIAGLGQTATGVGQIMSGDIVGGTMAAMSGISSVVSALDGLFGADYSRYNAMKEEYEKLNSVWDELINKKKEYIKTSYGDEAYKVGREAEELSRKAIENYRILGRERLNAGASAGSHSIGRRQWRDMSDEGWRQAQAALGSDWKKEYGDKSRMNWLFDLSSDQLSKLKEAGVFWAKLDDDVRGYLDSIIEGQERIADINQAVQEQLTQVSFDSVRNKFIDQLLDMRSDASDFAEDFSSYMQRAILNAHIAELMDDELKQWYNDFAKANSDGSIDESEYKKLQDQWQNIVDTGLDMREKLKEAFNWDSSDSSSQQASKGYSVSMNQDTGDKVVGILTSGQMIWLGVDAKLGILQANSSESLLTIKNYGNIFFEMRNIALQSMSYLEDISTYTKKYLPTMANDLSEVKRNTSNL